MQANGWPALFFAIEARWHDSKHEVLKYLLGTERVDVMYKDEVRMSEKALWHYLLLIKQRGNTAMDVAKMINPATLKFFPEANMVNE